MKQVFPSCIPLVKAGEDANITVSQSLDGRLKQDSPSKVHVRIDGPQLALLADIIAGAFPAPGSDQSPDEFLPHIALSRRTLPWERQGPDPNPNIPWLALLLFKESELRTETERKQSPAATVTSTKVQNIPDITTRNRLLVSLKIPGSADVRILTVANSVLRKVMPKLTDLPLLCHMKRESVNSTDSDSAIVISNRLPDASAPDNEKPELHTAVLVSLEKAAELLNLPVQGATSLVVLHHWTFRPSKGGDFEQVMKSVAYRPNGGVLRFGNLPAPVEQGQQQPLSGGFRALIDSQGYFLEPFEHDLAGNAIYRTPLRPFEPPPRSKGFAISPAPDEFANVPDGTPLDYSHATAFELGRLLALNDPGILEDLREVRGIMKPIEPPVLANPLPPALQKPDWVVNPAWSSQPWEFDAGQSLVKNENLFLGKGAGDVTGIQDHLAVWDVGSIVTQIEQVGSVVTVPVSILNIGTVGLNVIEEQFADVAQAAKG